MKQSRFFSYVLLPAGALLGAIMLLMLPSLPRAAAIVPAAMGTVTASATVTRVLPTPTHTLVPLPTPTMFPTPTPTPTRPVFRPFFREEVPTPTPRPLPDAADVPILMYHYVEELPADADSLRRGLTVTPDLFEAQLQYLAEAGYHTVTLADLHRYLVEGVPLPEKPIILTFDDGYRDAYTVVFPLLQEYGFVGTFFVLATPSHFASPNYLTWDMMAEMAAAGMEVQGHGRDHVDMRNRSYEYLVYQLLGIKEAVEYHTGQPVRFFCYPSGQYDAAVIRVLQSAGYWGAVTTQHGRVHTREGLYTLARIRIRGSDALDDFAAYLEGR